MAEVGDGEELALSRPITNSTVGSNVSVSTFTIGMNNLAVSAAVNPRGYRCLGACLRSFGGEVVILL